MPNRTVFFVSDGTGITAETFGKAILAQFEISPRQVRLPFMDSVDKAHQAVRQINHAAEVDGKRPIVFSTLVNMEVLAVIKEKCQGMLLDMFGTFVAPLEQELSLTSNHRVGRFSDVSKSQEYHDRIEAINFSLAHDDGQSNRDLSSSDVILVGVSRSGKPQHRCTWPCNTASKRPTTRLSLKTLTAMNCHQTWRPLSPSYLA